MTTETRSNTQPEARPLRVLNPVVDVLESEDGLLVLADVPGARLEDLTLNLDKGVLSLSAIRHLDGERYLEYRRRFQVPRSTDPAAVTASLERGVLRVTLPKADAHKPRRIAISVG